MSTFTPVNILDMADAIGEEALCSLLSDYSCQKNQEIETYVKHNALEFAKRKISITYLVLDDMGELSAIFTLTHKPIEICIEGLTATLAKRLSRYAYPDEDTGAYMISAFLIAQFGKNFSAKNVVSGDELMEITLGVLSGIQHEIGGGVVYLECEDQPKLLDFYQNDRNRFRAFGERISESDKTRYIQLLRIL